MASRASVAWAGVLAVVALAVPGADGIAPLIVQHARLYDAASGRTTAPTTIVVSNGRIEALNADDAPMPTGGRIVDAQGGTAVPALTDALIHIAATSALDRDYFHVLSVLHGVMRLRVVDGRLPFAVDDRERSAAWSGARAQIWVSGPRVTMRHARGRMGEAVLATGLVSMQPVTDPTSAAAAASAQAAAGVDWVRLDGQAPPAVVAAVTGALRKTRARVSAGAYATSMRQLAEHGVSLIEGLGVPVAIPADMYTDAATRQPLAAAAVVETAWARLTPAEVTSLATALVKRQVAIAPLLFASDASGSASKDDLLFLPARAHADVGARAASAPSRQDAERSGRARARQRDFLNAFAKAGGRLVLASGSGVTGYPVPGRAVLQEAAALVRAGLDASRVWRAGVVDGALLMGVPDGSTRLTAGAPADFFVIKSDPLALSATSLPEVSVVVRRGELLDRAALLRRAVAGPGASR